MLVTLVLYVALQVAFIGAVDPASLAQGWHSLDFTSPFAHLAIAINLNWLAMLLYLDAFVSPSGTGIIHVAISSRIIMAMERNDTMPRIFGKVHPVYGAPRAAMWLNLVVCFAFLYCFRRWGPPHRSKAHKGQDAGMNAIPGRLRMQKRCVLAFRWRKSSKSSRAPAIRCLHVLTRNRFVIINREREIHAHR